MGRFHYYFLYCTVYSNYVLCAVWHVVLVKHVTRKGSNYLITAIVYVLLPENLRTYFKLSVQAWTLYKAP